MASVRADSLLNGVSGRIGPLIVRQCNGRTIVYGIPRKPQKESVLQRENRVRFKSASFYAKCELMNPEKKAYYLQKAKKLKYPNAYTAAITDYMRKGKLDEVDTTGYKGKAGNTIRIKARKKDFAVNDIRVDVVMKDGTFVETGYATRKSPVEFVYSLKKDHPQKIPLSIRVAFKNVDDVVMKEVDV